MKGMGPNFFFWKKKISRNILISFKQIDPNQKIPHECSSFSSGILFGVLWLVWNIWCHRKTFIKVSPETGSSAGLKQQPENMPWGLSLAAITVLRVETLFSSHVERIKWTTVRIGPHVRFSKNKTVVLFTICRTYIKCSNRCCLGGFQISW